MSDEPDPPRKTYGFKPRTFEAANELPTNAPPPQTPARDPGITPAAAGPIDVRDLARHATGDAPLLSTTPAPNRANDIHAMLQGNLARANAAGLNELAPKIRRPSRRRRDYWLLLAGIDGLTACSLFIVGINPVSVFVVLAAIAFFSAAVTWIMWHVMDEY